MNSTRLRSFPGERGCARSPAPAYLVDSDTDAVYKPWRGAVYAPGEVKGSFAEYTELHFYVSRAGELVFLERVPGSWTEHVERRERRRARA
jgi:hypothetical protein